VISLSVVVFPSVDPVSVAPALSKPTTSVRQPEMESNPSAAIQTRTSTEIPTDYPSAVYVIGASSATC
jgi:hypothetical protein